MSSYLLNCYFYCSWHVTKTLHFILSKNNELQKIEVLSSRSPRQTCATKLDQMFVIILCQIMCPLTCLIVFTVAGLLACHKHVAFHFAHEFQKIDVISSRLPRQTRATKLDQIFVIIFCHIMFPLTCVIVTSTLAHISVTRCISSNKISCRKQK